MPGRRRDPAAEPYSGPGSRTLADFKSAHRLLQGLDEGELKRIAVLPAGARLAQGSNYLDLGDENARPFTALGGETADEDSICIAKSDVDYVLWNRLTGVSTPERLDEPGDSAAGER